MAVTDAQTQDTEADAPAVTLTEPARDPQPLPPPEARPVVRPARRSGFLGLLLGGALAAGAGYGLAQYVPNGWPITDTSALQAALDAQKAEIADLKAQLAGNADIEARVAALESTSSQPDLAPLTEAVAGLTGRVAAIEALPKDGSSASPAAIAALGDAVAKLQSDLQVLQANPGAGNAPALAAEAEARLREAEAQAAQMKAEAEALTRAATARAALGRLQTALDTGAPFAGILPDLGEDLPAALTQHAEAGVPSLQALQASFPDAARAALDAALRADMGESWTERAASFLRSQTGARSLTPREGSDPDAVLSRAEAALASGDLAKVMTELSALPEVAKTAMAPWQAEAETRMAAEAAVQQLAAGLAE